MDFPPATPLTPPSETVNGVMATVRALMATSTSGDFHIQDIVTVTRHAMQVVDTYPDLTGKGKKKVVLDVCQRLMDEVDHDTWNAAKPFAMPIINATIDELVDAHQGNLRLRPRWRRALRNLCKCCCNNGRRQD